MKLYQGQASNYKDPKSASRCSRLVHSENFLYTCIAGFVFLMMVASY